MQVDLKGIEKSYRLSGGVTVPALREVDLRIGSGDFVALVGPSGCGKTTLLSVIGLLAGPTAGRYVLEGREMSGLSRREQAMLRASSIGFIFQAYNLLPRERAWRNVILPLSFRRAYRRGRRERGMAALQAVGLEHRAGHYPSQMSGGEQQRVAIARALINEPRLILADEPTGNLDSRTGEEILSLIAEVASRRRSTVVVATHDRSVAGRARRIVEMKDGRIVSDREGN